MKYEVINEKDIKKVVKNECIKENNDESGVYKR